MGFIEKIEIIKGLISSQYGNSSGGVISLTSNKIDDISFLETRYLIGSYGLNQFQIKTSKKFNKSNYLFSFSRNQFVPDAWDILRKLSSNVIGTNNLLAQ